ncbi:hypothetical protein ACH4U7_17040 [Streptomyces sp. NPDC020845]
MTQGIANLFEALLRLLLSPSGRHRAAAERLAVGFRTIHGVKVAAQ